MKIYTDLFGNEVDEFLNAKERYGVWPTTVWDCDTSDSDTQKLKQQIGDTEEQSTRKGSFYGGQRPDDKSVYRGKVTASIFNPAIAAWILNCYAPKQGICLDPFAGGGTRALMAAKHGLRYIGYELRPEEVKAVTERCERHEVSKQVRIIQGDSRQMTDMPDNYADFLITCPPYFNLEQYNGGGADLSMAPDYLHFLAGIYSVIRETYRILKQGAISCWVVGLLRNAKGELIPMHHDITRIHHTLPFFHKEEVVLAHKNNGAIQRVGNFEKGQKHLIRMHEYLLVFRKGIT